MSLLIGANDGVPERSDSSAPQSARVTMGGCGTSFDVWPALVVLVVDVELLETPKTLVVVGSGPPPGSPGAEVVVVPVEAAVTRPAGTTWRSPLLLSMATIRRSRT